MSSKLVEPSGETVYVGTGSSSVNCYHTNEDCQKFERCSGSKAIDKSFAEWKGLTLCKRCEGTGNENYVTDSQCRQLRRDLAGERNSKSVAAKHDIHPRVASEHASGRCTCDAGPSLTYDQSKRQWIHE